MRMTSFPGTVPLRRVSHRSTDSLTNCQGAFQPTRLTLPFTTLFPAG
jgi:hypothetical protein